MKISTKYLKSLLSCYEKSFHRRQKRIMRMLRDGETRGKLEPLEMEQAKTEGKMMLCKWLIEMSEIPESTQN